MSLKPITVQELVAHLQTLPQHLPVAYPCCSEYALLELNDVSVTDLQPARPDGWVHHARPDKPTTTYVLLPG
jgi:hypothetical protein